MRKINFLYKEYNETLINRVSIYINGQDYGGIEKNIVRTIGLESGTYEIIIYTANITYIGINGARVERKECVKETIVIEDSDLYYTFKLPLFVNLKCRYKKIRRF